MILAVNASTIKFPYYIVSMTQNETGGSAIVRITRLLTEWDYSHHSASLVDGNYPGMGIFRLWMMFNPAAWLLVRYDLNPAVSSGR